MTPRFMTVKGAGTSASATCDTENEALVTSDEIIDGTSYSAGMVRVTTSGGSATYPVMYTVH